VRWLLLLTALFAALPAWGAQVTLRLDAQTLQVGQSGRLTVYMVDGRTKHAPRLEAPEGVEISFAGSSQEFQDIQVEGQGFARVLVVGFRYRITAVVEGAVPIGPFQFTMTDGKKVRSNAVVMSVVPRNEAEELDAIDVDAGFGANKAWEGQVVVYSYKLTARVPTMRVQWQLPEFEGLRYPQHGQPVNNEYVIDDIDIKIHKAFGHHPLIATATGSKDFAAALAQVQIPNGRPNIFGVRPYKVEVRASEPAALAIRPLPQPVPPTFSGLVGDFSFRSRLDQEKAAVGQSVNWTIEVVGDGAIEGFEPPGYPDEKRISLYENGSTVRAWVDDDGDFRTTAAFKRVIVAAVEGELALDPLKIVTFSPTKGEYVTHEVAVQALQVSPGREGAGVGVESFGGAAPLAVAPVGDTIDFRENYRWGMGWAPPVANLATLAAFGAAVPSGGVLFLVSLARVRRWSAVRAESRKRPPTARDHLRALPDEPERRLTALDSALRLALAEYAKVSASTLDRAAVLQALPDEIRDHVTSVSDSLDRARFAGMPADRDLATDVRDAVVALEKAQ